MTGYACREGGGSDRVECPASGGRCGARSGRMSAMKPLPFPVRIAAGLVAISLEHARDLSRLVITFPVTAAGHALQTPRRVQQKVMELAIKGDCLLDRLFSEEEQPNSATFDEHEPLRHDHASIVTERRPVRRPSPVPTDEDVDLPEADPVLDELPLVMPEAEDVPVDTATDERAASMDFAEPNARPANSPEADALLKDLAPVLPEAEDGPADTMTDAGAATDVIGEATADPVDSFAAKAVLDDLPPVLPEAEDVPVDSVNGELAAETVVAKASAKPIDPSETPVLSGYAEMPIAELRSKLASLELDDLQALLAWEMAHGERAPFVTLLTNRIADVLEE